MARASHLDEDNPHGITPEAIGAVNAATYIQSENNRTTASGWALHPSPIWRFQVGRQGNIVLLSGLVRRQSGNDNLIGNLAPEERPKDRWLDSARCRSDGADQTVRIDVHENGDFVVMDSTVSSTIDWINLCGIV